MRSWPKLAKERLGECYLEMLGVLNLLINSSEFIL